ncbi:unnamed protein product [Arabis nemorensis]|uniref:AB hydrolase-1 domain-containing protein n=1 Tax=Arabis nemorensis TaxID=586526 RepID=A0A565CTZ9_9BRAS|nr:unnamed protein product [Arabis nemorensis]
MVGAWFVVGSSVLDSPNSPCLCLEGNMRSSPKKKKTILGSSRNLELGSSFIDSSIVFRLSSKSVSGIANRRSKKKLLIVNEDIAGNYDDTFGDVKTQIVNYFTYKAVRTVLHQLYEMNPPQYTWFYNHVVSNRPTEGKRFLRKLGKESQELAERVMITRLHLYGKWIKKCDHGKIYQEISDENLALMRERLMETVIWPSDDSNSELYPSPTSKHHRCYSIGESVSRTLGLLVSTKPIFSDKRFRLQGELGPSRVLLSRTKLLVPKIDWSEKMVILKSYKFEPCKIPSSCFLVTWNWKGYSIRYQCAGTSGPALVLVHGFGANSDHWRKNTPVLGKSHRVYSIDLIGYGYSDKPNPREFGGEPFYTFETWGEQLNDFCLEVVKDEAFFICNSIGGIVGLQAAVSKPEICRGLMLINISLRMLHIKKQPLIGRPFIRSFQNLLRNTPVGKLFFKTIATPKTVKSILCQCYHDSSQVTDELVEAILRPGLEPGAVDVFLEFICYSGGPLPEDLLPQVKCPVLIAWGEKDPWEPIELGREYSKFDAVEDFVVLPEAGHCPQDEKPEIVNPLIESFVARH